MTDDRPTGSSSRAGSHRFFLYRLAGRSRAMVLLAAMLVQIVLTSLNLGDHVVAAFYHITVILAAMVMAADEQKHLIVGWVIGLPAAVLTLAADLTRSDLLAWASYAVTTVLFVYIIRLMLHKIFRARIITLDTIGYALCVYVMLGALWTLFYTPLAVMDPDAFSQPLAGSGRSPGPELIYFSFVTLTTLGYGDISPVAPLARALAIIEALTGTLFLAVLISRLVGSYHSQRKD